MYIKFHDLNIPLAPSKSVVFVTKNISLGDVGSLISNTCKESSSYDETYKYGPSIDTFLGPFNRTLAPFVILVT
jgi:hypothetical protein